MLRKLTFFFLLIACLASQSLAQDMTLDRLKFHLNEEAYKIQENGAVVEYELDSVRIYLITDVASDRMRLMAGIVEEAQLTAKDLKILMEANYDRALDAKYALSDGVLWAVFVHPLKDLTTAVLKSGLYQVRNLVYSYGTSYTSTQFVFGGEEDDGGD